MNDMALTERDIELVRLAAKEAAHAVLLESEPDRRRMAREEAWTVASKAIAMHIDNCKVPGQMKIGYLKLVIFGLVCGGGSGGMVAIAPSVIKLIEAMKL